MKTISDYTIFCTEAQTKKAIELGAPINTIKKPNTKVYLTERITAEQMIGFILDSGRGYASDLAELIKEYGYKQGCLTFIDNYLK